MGQASDGAEVRAQAAIVLSAFIAPETAAHSPKKRRCRGPAVSGTAAINSASGWESASDRPRSARPAAELLRIRLGKPQLLPDQNDLECRVFATFAATLRNRLTISGGVHGNVTPYMRPRSRSCRRRRLPLATHPMRSSLALAELVYAHRQHHYIVEALERRESSRAQMLLREHATIQRHGMNL